MPTSWLLGKVQWVQNSGASRLEHPQVWLIPVTLARRDETFGLIFPIREELVQRPQTNHRIDLIST